MGQPYLSVERVRAKDKSLGTVKFLRKHGMANMPRRYVISQNIVYNITQDIAYRISQGIADR